MTLAELSEKTVKSVKLGDKSIVVYLDEGYVQYAIVDGLTLTNIPREDAVAIMRLSNR